MQLQLPSIDEVTHAIQAWRANDDRLGTLLGRYDDKADALRHYGLVLWGGGDALAGSKVLAAAIALKPADARIWADLSSALGGLGERAGALSCAEQSLALDPGQSAMWLQLGSIRSMSSESDAAIAAYERALAINPELVDAWIGIGLDHLRAKRFHQAIPPFREAIARGSAEDANVQGCFGEALSSIGDFENGRCPMPLLIACRFSNLTTRALQAEAALGRNSSGRCNTWGSAEDAVGALRATSIERERGRSTETVLSMKPFQSP